MSDSQRLRLILNYTFKIHNHLSSNKLSVYYLTPHIINIFLIKTEYYMSDVCLSYLMVTDCCRKRRC